SAETTTTVGCPCLVMICGPASRTWSTSSLNLAFASATVHVPCAIAVTINDLFDHYSHFRRSGKIVRTAADNEDEGAGTITAMTDRAPCETSYRPIFVRRSSDKSCASSAVTVPRPMIWYRLRGS